MATTGKVRELHALAAELGRRAAGRRVVHCHGVFDLLHIGHIKHLEAARKLGDALVVTLTPDRFVNKGPLSYLIGDWTVSGIWSATSGDYITPTLAGAVSNSTGGGGDRPNRIANGNLDAGSRSIDRWFDLTAFTTPAQFTFGNSGRSFILGPGQFNVDLGVHRNFNLSERRYLSFRWEMFNAFNRANFGDPNAAIGNSVAGQISGTQPARIMQVALKAVF